MSVLGAVDAWLARLRHRPLVARVAGYGLGSVIAAATSELAFVAVYAGAHGGPVWSSAAGFVGGAVPNYFLNRRWAWRDRTGRDRRTEAVLYASVALASFVASVFATAWAEDWARHLTLGAAWRDLMTAAAYLAVSGVFFVVKFVLYDLVVFTPARRQPSPAPPAAPTRS